MKMKSESKGKPNICVSKLSQVFSMLMGVLGNFLVFTVFQARLFLWWRLGVKTVNFDSNWPVNQSSKKKTLCVMMLRNANLNSLRSLHKISRNLSVLCVNLGMKAPHCDFQWESGWVPAETLGNIDPGNNISNQPLTLLAVAGNTGPDWTCLPQKALLCFAS